MATIKLNKKELLFLKQATVSTDGIFDFENNTDEEFKEAYGLTPTDIGEIATKLNNIVHDELDKFKK